MGDDPDTWTFFFELLPADLRDAGGRAAAGVALPADFPAELEQTVAAFPPTMCASMANDLTAGNRLELD
jgi:ketopantoate reductase